ncbi:MAG: hypothetical protein COT91_01295, partial [Candidatus Doudnabacteria bacterium CG10_big_fil_rev_8_21_14_0_10_41_10]
LPGNRIFLDNFNDGNVYTPPNIADYRQHSWQTRDHGAGQVRWSIAEVPGENFNPFTLKGEMVSLGGYSCGEDNELWYIKGLVPRNFDEDDVVIMYRYQLLDDGENDNPTTLLMGNYQANGNPAQDQAYVIWVNYQNRYRLRLGRMNRMNEPINIDGVFYSEDDWWVGGQIVPANQWYWLGMKITRDMGQTNIAMQTWADGQAMPEIDDWPTFIDDTEGALSGGSFGVGLWADCAQSWYDDFQAYRL